MTNIKKSEEKVYSALLAGEIEIDDQGRIWRIGKRGWDRWNQCVRTNKCEKVRAEKQLPSGYLQIRAMINGTRHHALAHRLAWFHFRGSIPDGLVINHKNGNKLDNRMVNLEVVTPSENAQHSVRILKRGRCVNQYGENNHASKLTMNDVKEIRRRRNEEGELLRTIANDYGIVYQTVSRIALGHRWSENTRKARSG